MNDADVIELVQRAILTVVIVAGPMVGAASIVGITIALLQALTQVQEMTLTFVPKIVVILVVLSFAAPFIGATIYSFTANVYARIEANH